MTSSSTITNIRLRRPVRWSRWVCLGAAFLVICALQLALFHSYSSASTVSLRSAFSYKRTVCWYTLSRPRAPAPHRSGNANGLICQWSCGECGTWFRYRHRLSLSSHECHVTKAQSQPLRAVNQSPAPPPRFVFYRILGNDMPPLQSVGQLRRNLEYVLKYESEFPDCEKRWLLNRIVNATEKTLIWNLLGSHGYDSSRLLDIPFDVDDVANAPPNAAEVGLNPILTSRLHQMKRSEGEVKELGRKIRDIVGLNQGRNVALRDGLSSGARWVLLFDANQFVPRFSWSRIVKGAGEAEETKNVRYIEVPMVRLKEEQSLGWLHADADVAEVVSHSEGRMEEGQLIFRNDSSETFDENMAYSLAPKQELMDRICSFNSTTCACHDTVWWWTIKTTKAMRARIAPCGVSVRLWSYPDPPAAALKAGDGNARRDMRMESAHRFVIYVESLVEGRKKELHKSGRRA